MRCEITLDEKSRPMEMKVYVGSGKGTLTEVHKPGNDNNTVEVTRYIDGEKQAPVYKDLGDTSFISWNTMLATQQHQAEIQTTSRA